jgi:hypothetical protein
MEAVLNGEVESEAVLVFNFDGTDVLLTVGFG